MRTWVRATMDRCCGLCGAVMHRGAAMQVITIASLKTPRLRCELCAGQAPESLAPLVEPDPIPSTPLVHLRTGPDALPLDFKQLAGHEREPGEEG